MIDLFFLQIINLLQFFDFLHLHAYIIDLNAKIGKILVYSV
jgi:hypothetical protein